MREKIKKIKQGFYFEVQTLELLREVSKRHGLKMNHIVTQAVKKEIQSLQKTKPIV